MPADLAGLEPAGPTAEESARSIVDMLCAAVPAGDWQPDSDAEREELVRAVQRVFEVRGIAFNLPPEVILLTVMGKYTRKRMKKPAVAKRLAPWCARVPILGKLLGAPADAGDVDAGGQPVPVAGVAGVQPPRPTSPFFGVPHMTPTEE